MESATQPHGADDGSAGAGRSDVREGVFRRAADGGSDLAVRESGRRETLSRKHAPKSEPGCTITGLSRRRALCAVRFTTIRAGDGGGCRSAGRGPLGARTCRRTEPAAHDEWAALAGGLRERRLYFERC